MFDDEGRRNRINSDGFATIACQFEAPCDYLANWRGFCEASDLMRPWRGLCLRNVCLREVPYRGDDHITVFADWQWRDRHLEHVGGGG
jgi:hypothetical protein